MKNLTLILMSIIFTASISATFAVREYPLQTAKILATYKKKLKKSFKGKEKLIRMAKKTAITNLKKEMAQLTQTADLDRAIAARDLIRTIKDSSDMPDVTDDKKYRPNVLNIVKLYKKRLNQVAEFYEKKRIGIKNDLMTYLDKEMVKMDSEGFIADSLTIQALLEKVKAPEFSLLTFRFALQNRKSKKDAGEKELEKIVKKPQNNSNELIQKTSLALGNNILANDISSEQGLIYVCFSENLNPDNNAVLSVREKIENNLFISILPCSMSEDDFKTALEEKVHYLLENDKNNADLLKYCVMLLYLNPELKQDKKISSFIKNSGQPNSINAVLKFDKKIFGGTREAEDIRVQIDKTNSALIAKLLNQARQLQKRYPKNKNVRKLLDDMLKINAVTQKTEPKKASPNKIVEYKDCEKCNGTGWIDIQCPACKGKKGEVCGRCIGSGVIVSSENCPDCGGKGKTWLGTTCKKCKGKGKIKKKKPCPECEGTGTKKCSKCKGKGIIRKQCPICHGKGKVEVKGQ